MPKLITATDMIRSFSDIVGRVYYKGESYDIKKGNQIVARLSPAKAKSTIAISELNDFFRNSPRITSEDANSFEESLKSAREIKTDGGGSKWD